MKDHFPCHNCGKMTHIDDLDAKDDGTGNFTILHCEGCYGPGYVSAKDQFCPDFQNRRKDQ